MLDLTKAIQAAVADGPMENGGQPPTPGRVLYADGDGLCYYCAGRDDVTAGEARRRLITKVQAATRQARAERAVILTTAAGSDKGGRYAVARRLPYQAARKGSRRPQNWQYLRTLLEENSLPGMAVEFTDKAEADDLFGKHAALNPEAVTYTQDKDMNMVPGWHLDWLTGIMTHVDKSLWSKPKGDEQYWGRHWFWLQLLMGDKQTDNIPGLPYFVEDGTKKLIGPASAFKKLAGVQSDLGALLVSQDLYKSYYGDRWLVELLEQAVLLWIRNDAESRWDNVLSPGNPLDALRTHELFLPGYRELHDRIKDAQKYAKTEDNGGSSDEGVLAGISENDMRPVQTSPVPDEGGAGPRPLYGGSESSPALIVQQPARKDREQLQEVRHLQPSGLPAWGRGLLAKA